MATLTETAYYARRIVNWSIVGFIGLIVLRIALGLTLDAIGRAFPPPSLKPNYAFGKLPAQTFPASASASGELTLTLQTISGSLPIASDAARVFFMPKSKPNFLSLSKSQTLVGRIGFTDTPRQIGETTYRWIDTRYPLRSVEVDIVTNHFKIRYAYEFDLALFAERQIPSESEAIQETSNFLQTLALNIPDLDKSKTAVRYLKLIGNTLVPTTSQSQADAVTIDYFRRAYFEMKVLADKPEESLISITLGGSKRSEKRILSATYNYWPIDTQTVGVYALKTSRAAWEELTLGNAYFAKLPSAKTQIAITNIYLAYYDSANPQLFMQPIYVFEGDPQFAAYVPAITTEWTEVSQGEN
ncbi:MAG: hypothetical protein AAB874_06950 [Patescibacteria group bacterium]